MCAKVRSNIRFAIKQCVNQRNMKYHKDTFSRYGLVHFRRYIAATMFLQSHKMNTHRLSTRFDSTKPHCKNCQSLQILYFGSDAFSIGPLAKLLSRKKHDNTGKERIGNIEIVTSETPLLQRGTKKQKPSEFIEYAKQENLKIHPWNKDVLSKLPNYDFGIVASFGHLISKRVIQIFKRGMINAHPSLLPRWRGAAPIIHTILHGNKRTGVTIIDLSVGRFDEGKIFSQKELEVHEDWTAEILTDSLSNLAGDMVLEVIDDYDNYKANAWPQKEDGALQAPKISTDLSHIRWQDQTCVEIGRLYRAIGRKIGLHTYFDKRLVKLFEIKPLDERTTNELDETAGANFTPGRSWYNSKTKQLFIRCIDGWIEVSCLQMQYKKPVRQVDFYNAYMVDRKKTGNVKDLFHSNLTENDL